MAESRSQTNVHDIDDLPEEWANKLDAAGYDDLDSVVNATVEDLIAIEGIDDEIAGQIIELARRHEEVQSGEGGEQEETYQEEDADAEGEEQQASGEASDEKQEEAQVE